GLLELVAADLPEVDGEDPVALAGPQGGGLALPDWGFAARVELELPQQGVDGDGAPGGVRVVLHGVSLGLVARAAGLVGVVAAPGGDQVGAFVVVLTGLDGGEELAGGRVGVTAEGQCTEEAGGVGGRSGEGEQVEVGGVTGAVQVPAAVSAPEEVQRVGGVPSGDLPGGGGLVVGGGVQVGEAGHRVSSRSARAVRVSRTAVPWVRRPSFQVQSVRTGHSPGR